MLYFYLFFFFFILENDGELPDTESNDTIGSMNSDFIPKHNRKKISLVWKYFKKSNNKKYAKCITCGKEYKTSGNTTNLKDHIKRFHPTLYNLNYNGNPIARVPVTVPVPVPVPIPVTVRVPVPVSPVNIVQINLVINQLALFSRGHFSMTVLLKRKRN